MERTLECFEYLTHKSTGRESLEGKSLFEGSLHKRTHLRGGLRKSLPKSIEYDCRVKNGTTWQKKKQ